MSVPETDDTQKTEPETADQQREEPTITETQLKDRLAKQQRSFDRQLKEQEDQFKKLIERSKMDEAERIKVENDEKLASANKRAEEAEHQLRVISAEKILAEKGLSTAMGKVLLGADDDETMANIKAYEADVNALAKKLYAQQVKTTSPEAPGKGSSDALLESMKKAARI